MHRVNLDQASEAVKKFVRSLPIDSEGVELTLNGQVLCRVLEPRRIMAAEVNRMLQRGWELVERTQSRNRHVPNRVIEREVRAAVTEVRRRASKQ